jgi:NADH dehydrogenase
MAGNPHVVILGGGFAGLYAARALTGAPVRVTVVDRRNHHLFQPLLYQVATAGLAAPDIAAPIRKVLRRQDNATVLLAEVVGVDPGERRVRLADGELDYDRLIVATGTEHGYFGRDEWAPFAPGLKTLEDAFEIRRRVLLAFEHAEREQDPERRAAWLTFAVIGAGPTGVELAGALREIATKTLTRDFRNFDPGATRVVLADLAERVLPTFPERLSEAARAELTRLGIELRLGWRVTEIDADGVALGDERIPARTVLWAAGVKPSPVAADLGGPLSKDGRVEVAPDLSVPGRPEIYVAGDLAFVRDACGEVVPGMAPGAIQEGRAAAANVLRSLAGEQTRPFEYRDRGVLATIGRSAAVARIGRFCFSGFFAWVLWLFVHVLWLIGFRSRVVVMFEWAWAYLTYQRSARVILDPERGRGPQGSGTLSAP